MRRGQPAASRTSTGSGRRSTKPITTFKPILRGLRWRSGLDPTVRYPRRPGPPVLPNYFYNNLHQIVQTRDAVMILTEMVHDARIVRMNTQHLPKKIRKWMGDSVGHWEGDTLVVDTTNFTDKTRFRGSSEDLHVIERFSRVDAKTLLYRFTIEDPATWAKPWTGEYTWPATGEHIYEYACHEANYALGDVLRGARLREADEAAKTKK